LRSIVVRPGPRLATVAPLRLVGLPFPCPFQTLPH